MHFNSRYFSNDYLIKLGVFVFFLIYVIVFSFQINTNIQYENGYTLGDWLINYQDGGFKRRGLSGSFFIWMYDYLHVPIKISVFFFQFCLNLIFTGFFFLILLKRRVKLNFLLLMFSPCIFLFFFTEMGSIGRKEIILFASYSYFLFRLNNRSLTIWEIYWPFVIIVPIGILFHELFFFFELFFIFPLFTIDRDRFSFKSKLSLILIFFCISASLIISLWLFGGEINQGKTFDELEARGISSTMRNLGNFGILTWNDKFDKFTYFVHNHYYKYAISIILSIITFLFFVKTSSTKLSVSQIFFVLITSGLTSLPLYFLAIDWGRWLNIQCIMTVLFLGYSLKNIEDLEKYKSPFNFGFILISIFFIVFWRFELVDVGFRLAKYF